MYKLRRGFGENKNFKKSRIEKTPLFFKKKTKIEYNVLRLRKRNIKTKVIPFEKSHNAENSKMGPFEIFNIHFVAKFQKKLKGDPMESLKNFRNKTWEILTVSQRRKTEKRDPLDFSTFVLLQKIKQIEGRTLLGH